MSYGPATHEDRSLYTPLHENLVLLGQGHLQSNERRPKDGQGTDDAQHVCLFEAVHR